MKNPLDSNIAKKENIWQIWVARSLIGVVLFWNLLAAFQFIINPQRYIGSFQVEGIPGQTAIIGFGILFLMWQVPYIFAFIHPIRFKNSLWQALIMQTIGFLGESILLSNIPKAYQPLRSSLQRFIIFDSVGILILFYSLFMLHSQTSRQKNNDQKQDR